MSFKDKSGIEIITLKDLLEEPVLENQEGLTLRIVLERAVGKKFKDSGKYVDGTCAGLQSIKFWVILDCGSKGERFRPFEMGAGKQVREDRYVMVGVALDQTIYDVELEERGIALPGIYRSFDEAVEAVADLCTACRIMES